MELLVVIAMIAMLAAMLFGALSAARNAANERKTRATIAKLHTIIMERWESYATRRVPVDLATDASGNIMGPHDVAYDRVYAIRDLMRMEMPDRAEDITNGPITLPYSGKLISRPALSSLYLTYYNANAANPDNGVKNGASELLYLIVSKGSPEALEQFDATEIGDTNGNGWPEFLDGWGRPIFFLRWAPGYSTYSGIQSGNATTDHDPFDPRNVDTDAFRLIPLVYSGGPNLDPGLGIGRDATNNTNPATNWWFALNGTVSSPKYYKNYPMFTDTLFRDIGKPLPGLGVGDITNHNIGTR